jgi:hypothetical protein
VVAPERGAAPWAPALEAIDAALARGDVGAARKMWLEARGAALRSRRWEALVEVGDTVLKIGAAGASRLNAESTARETYLAALFMAHQQGSREGVLRAAEAFDALGDAEVAGQALEMAEALAGPERGLRVPSPPTRRRSGP